MESSRKKIHRGRQYRNADPVRGLINGLDKGHRIPGLPRVALGPKFTGVKKRISFLFRWGILMVLGCIPPSSYGQKSELTADVYSGLFFFRGNGSTARSVINEEHAPNLPSFTANPYGSTSGFSYAVELQWQRVSRDNNLYGLGAGFEELTSKVTIDQLNVSNTLSVLVNGNTRLENDFITVHPFLGHRFLLGKVRLDGLAGLDAGFCLSSRETGKISSAPETRLKDIVNRPQPLVDVRPRAQLIAALDRWGLSAGYSMGLTNYQQEGNGKAYSNFIRLGVTYRLHR